MAYLPKVFLKQLFGAVAQHLAEAWIYPYPLALRAEQGHADGSVFKVIAENFLADAQLFKVLFLDSNILKSTVDTQTDPFSYFGSPHGTHPARIAFGCDNLYFFIKRSPFFYGQLYCLPDTLAAVAFFIKIQGCGHFGCKIIGYFVNFARDGRPMVYIVQHIYIKSTYFGHRSGLLEELLGFEQLLSGMYFVAVVGKGV